MSHNKTFGLLLGTVTALIFSIILGTKAAQSATYEEAMDSCIVIGEYGMDVAMLRDKGIRADVVFEYSVKELGLKVDFARTIVQGIYQNPKLTPSEIGYSFFNACMERLAPNM